MPVALIPFLVRGAILLFFSYQKKKLNYCHRSWQTDDYSRDKVMPIDNIKIKLIIISEVNDRAASRSRNAYVKTNTVKSFLVGQGDLVVGFVNAIVIANALVI